MHDEAHIGDWLEGDTGLISFTLEDENGDPVPKASLDSLTMSLYLLDVPATQTTAPSRYGYGLLPQGYPTVVSTVGTTTINDRDVQDVLDANNVTMHATTGVVTWDVQREDVPFLGSDDSAKQIETHVAHFRASWGGSPATESKSYLIYMRVRNVRRYAVD